MQKASISDAILFLRLQHVYFPFQSEFHGKRCAGKGAWRSRWHLVPPTLCIIIVQRVNLNKLSRNFVGVLTTTTTNCRVSFTDLYLVFPKNFGIVFLRHILKHCNFAGTVLRYYHRAWVTCGKHWWAVNFCRCEEINCFLDTDEYLKNPVFFPRNSMAQTRFSRLTAENQVSITFEQYCSFR